MTAVVATRRTATWFLIAALALGVCAKCRTVWESAASTPARPVIGVAASR